MILGVDHVQIAVRDIDAYGRLLTEAGYRLVFRDEVRFDGSPSFLASAIKPLAFFRRGNFAVEVVQAEGPEAGRGSALDPEKGLLIYESDASGWKAIQGFFRRLTLRGAEDGSRLLTPVTPWLRELEVCWRPGNPPGCKDEPIDREGCVVPCFVSSHLEEDLEDFSAAGRAGSEIAEAQVNGRAVRIAVIRTPHHAPVELIQFG